MQFPPDDRLTYLFWLIVKQLRAGERGPGEWNNMGKNIILCKNEYDMMILEPETREKREKNAKETRKTREIQISPRHVCDQKGL
jgi:hypothetical protein